MKNYLRLINFVRPHSGSMVRAFFCMLITSALGGFPIGLIVPFVDTVLAGRPVVLPHQDKLPLFMIDWVQRLNLTPRLQVLNLLIVTVIAVMLLRSLFIYLQSYFMNDASQKVILDIRNQIYMKLLGLSLSFFNKNQTGVLVSRITYDAGIIRDAISEGLTDFFYQPARLVVLTIVLLTVRQAFGISWNLVFIIFVVLPLVVYPIMRIGQRLRKISLQNQEQMADINSTLIETISGIRVVQAFGMESYERDRFNLLNVKFYRTMMLSISRMIAVTPITEFVGFLCFGVVLWYGGKEVVGNNLSPGAFVAFLAALFSLLQPFKRLSRLHSINQHAMAAAMRIFEILDSPSEIVECGHPKPLPPIREGIVFKNISFSYDSRKARALENIDLKVKAGEIVAIVGPSGAGKTTLVNLIPRFYDPSLGTVLIDGTDVKELSIRSLRNQIGIVTQETILFNDTVSANIAYGQAKISQNEIERAAKIANAHDFIMKLPKRYETKIGDRGIQISGGERQRLSIARAVLKNPPILILDEATSSLDSESELLVRDAIDKLMKGRTAFVIAHRLSTVQNANSIIVLEKGKIVEAGSHQELLEAKGLYYRLYQYQFHD